MIKFYKYHGAGNDFIIINNISGIVDDLSIEQIQNICNRRFGIGADGLMLLKPHAEFDFEMDYYNADGSGGTMCGNGGRCIVAFAKKLDLINKRVKFLASDGIHDAFIDENNIVKLKMTNVENVNKIGKDYTCYTGSPHFIRFEEDIINKDVFEAGRKIRYSNKYKEDGINVNFVKLEGDKTLSIRTYERGVENETFACGTGAVASALTFAEKNHDTSAEYTVNVKGGILKVSFEKKNNTFENIWLTGPAEFVFEGDYNL